VREYPQGGKGEEERCEELLERGAMKGAIFGM
jgi:hypothetical protein